MKHSWWQKCLRRIERTSNLNGLHGLTCRICRQLNLDYFLVLGGQPSHPVQAGLAALSGLPDSWWQALTKAGDLASDPTLCHAQRSNLPLFWSDLAAEDTATRAFLENLGNYDIQTGLTLPVHGPAGSFGLLNLANGTAHPEPERSLRTALPRARLVADYLVTALLRCNEPQPELPTSPLTGRERDCLLWTAKGKTSWEISNILRIGERTVIYHLNNVLRKLCAANRQQAVAKALALGLLVPELRLEAGETGVKRENNEPAAR